MDKRQYYWKWFRRATGGKLGVAEKWTGILTVIAAFIALMWKPLGSHMDIIPLVVFGAVFFGTVVVGFLTAPFWMHREVEQERDTLQIQLKKSQISYEKIAKLDELVRKAKVMKIIDAGSYGKDVTEDVFTDVEVWVNEVVTMVEEFLGAIANTQLRAVAELPQDGSIQMEHLQRKLSGKTVEGPDEVVRLAIVRDRYYDIKRWLEDYIESPPPTSDM